MLLQGGITWRQGHSQGPCILYSSDKNGRQRRRGRVGELRPFGSSRQLEARLPSLQLVHGYFNAQEVATGLYP